MYVIFLTRKYQNDNEMVKLTEKNELTIINLHGRVVIQISNNVGVLYFRIQYPSSATPAYHWSVFQD